MKKLCLLLCGVMLAATQLYADNLTPDEVIKFKETSTRDLNLYVFYPDGQKAGADRTVIVSFFGGGWVSGKASQFFEQSRDYAAQGIVAISAEYRIESIDKTTPFESVADSKSAIRWVRAHAKELGIDPNKIVASGGSAGGHVAACTALIEKFDDKTDANSKVSSVANALILLNPVVNTSDGGYGKTKFHGEELTMSPFHHIREGMPPTLIMHGTQDGVVPFKNAVDFTKTMKYFDNDIRLITAFGENHSFFNSKSMRAKASTPHYERCVYESLKFLMDINFIPTQELSKPSPIRIAYVGDGASAETDANAAQLQKLVGDDYEVKCFSYSGATVLPTDGKGYIDSKSCEELYDYEADVIIMMLGASDLQATTWAQKDAFTDSYKTLITKMLKHEKSTPEIYVCSALPTSQSSEVIEKELNPMIKKAAQQSRVKYVNAYDNAAKGNKGAALQYIYDFIGSEQTLKEEIEMPRKKNPDTFDGVLQSAPYHQMRGGLKNSYKKFTETKKGTIAFLGGSITWNPGWRDMVCEYFQQKFPDTEFTFIGAGISSEGTTSASFRLERDVLSKGEVDLLFEEAAVNDRDGSDLRVNTVARVRGMEGIVRHARAANPMMDIVIMQFVDQYKIATYNKGGIPVEIVDFEGVAEHYDVPSINLAKEVTDRIKADEFTWKDDFKNLHPSPFGQRVYARSMIEFLESAYADGDEVQKFTKYKMAKPLDPFCYEEGYFVRVVEAQLGEGWSIDPAWRPNNGQSMRDLNDLHINKECLVAREKSGEMTLEFVGSTIGIVALVGADAGKIEYSIDGGEFKEYDLFMNYGLSQYLPRYFTLATDLDHKKRHTLTIRLADSPNPKSKGHACYIARFFVNGKNKY